MKHLKKIPSKEDLEQLRRACLLPADPDDLEGIDLQLVRSLAPVVAHWITRWYRMEVEGMELVPDGPALLVGNHNSGAGFFELVGLGAHLYVERGSEEVIHSLAHDVLMRLPGLGNLLNRLGALRADPTNALAALAAGRKVIVCPGGNLEAFRPFSERHRIRFGGRKGFLKLAIQAQVPLVPWVTIGGHESFFVLTDGQWLARLLRMDRLMRSQTWPIFLGLPYGLAIGPTMHLPLPVKVRFRFLEPISLAGYRPEQAEDPRALESLYQLVVGRMQQALDELAAHRRWPILG
ncbi:MAG: acyltransferase family protein [Deltaproteobacteria bacterium]|nr:acyltransferase family protein [Deltaproteobacteria bacterium]